MQRAFLACKNELEKSLFMIENALKKEFFGVWGSFPQRFPKAEPLVGLGKAQKGFIDTMGPLHAALSLKKRYRT